ncbi:hypothetical protein GALMADRAFT_132767 [Galerina marginata CBS 339.88]|uniref:Uncharacterized protein n=1 Tax=Galerina marginata (strain CBS 339.88) TaxID=685588 RepID=A0A067TSI0_GALM3|nr:hypothetical protein GALMADRAFT_132767 [Galerina marginata CBS 339.88]
MFVYQSTQLPLRSFDTISYMAASGVLQHWSPQQRPLRSSRCCTPFKIGIRGINWTGVCTNPDASPPANPSVARPSVSPGRERRLSLVKYAQVNALAPVIDPLTQSHPQASGQDGGPHLALHSFSAVTRAPGATETAFRCSTLSTQTTRTEVIVRLLRAGARCRPPWCVWDSIPSAPPDLLRLEKHLPSWNASEAATTPSGLVHAARSSSGNVSEEGQAIDAASEPLESNSDHVRKVKLLLPKDNAAAIDSTGNSTRPTEDIDRAPAGAALSQFPMDNTKASPMITASPRIDDSQHGPEALSTIQDEPSIPDPAAITMTVHNPDNREASLLPDVVLRNSEYVNTKSKTQDYNKIGGGELADKHSHYPIESQEPQKDSEVGIPQGRQWDDYAKRGEFEDRNGQYPMEEPTQLGGEELAERTGPYPMMSPSIGHGGMAAVSQAQPWLRHQGGDDMFPNMDHFTFDDQEEDETTDLHYHQLERFAQYTGDIVDVRPKPFSAPANIDPPELLTGRWGARRSESVESERPVQGNPVNLSPRNLTTGSWVSRVPSTAIHNVATPMPMHSVPFYTANSQNWDFSGLMQESSGSSIVETHNGQPDHSGATRDGEPFLGANPAVVHNPGDPNFQYYDASGPRGNSEFANQNPQDFQDGHAASSSPQVQQELDGDGDVDMDRPTAAPESENVLKARLEMDRRALIVLNAQFDLEQEKARFTELEINSKAEYVAGTMSFLDVLHVLNGQKAKVDGGQSDLSMAKADHVAAKEIHAQEVARAEFARLELELAGLKALDSNPSGLPFQAVIQIRREIKEKTGRIAYLKEYLGVADNHTPSMRVKRNLEDTDDGADNNLNAAEKGRKNKPKAKKVEQEDISPKQGTGPETPRERLESLGKITSDWLTQIASKVTSPESELRSLPMLSKEDNIWAEAEGQRQIDLYFSEDGTDGDLGPTVRKWCFSFPRYLSHCAWTNKDLAILVHTSKQGGVRRCRFHAINRSLTIKNTFDGCNKGNKVEGVSHSVNLKGGKAIDDDHFHCGCLTDHVLLDFFLWKTVSASQNLNPQVTETMRQNTFEPRMRSFLLAGHQQYSGFTASDIPWANPPLSLSALVQKLKMKITYNLVRELVAMGYRLNLVQNGQMVFND